jgi:hypothetical protein
MIGRLLALALLALATPCYFFGCLGVQGQLTDTSQKENLQQGAFFLGTAFILTLPFVVYLIKSARSKSE